jgi:hypothetical protein
LTPSACLFEALHFRFANCFGFPFSRSGFSRGGLVVSINRSTKGNNFHWALLGELLHAVEHCRLGDGKNLVVVLLPALGGGRRARVLRVIANLLIL